MAMTSFPSGHSRSGHREARLFCVEHLLASDPALERSRRETVRQFEINKNLSPRERTGFPDRNVTSAFLPCYHCARKTVPVSSRRTDPSSRLQYEQGGPNQLRNRGIGSIRRKRH